MTEERVYEVTHHEPLVVQQDVPDRRCEGNIRLDAAWIGAVGLLCIAKSESRLRKDTLSTIMLTLWSRAEKGDTVGQVGGQWLADDARPDAVEAQVRVGAKALPCGHKQRAVAELKVHLGGGWSSSNGPSQGSLDFGPIRDGLLPCEFLNGLRDFPKRGLEKFV